MATKIQIRRGSSNQWGSSNPVLSDGELSVDNDTLQMKIGDGETSYSKLKYLKAEKVDNLSLGDACLTNIFMYNYNENDDTSCEDAFDRMGDFFSCGNIVAHNILPEYITLEIFDFEGKPLGKFGPNLSKADIMREIKRVGFTDEEDGRGIYIKFYIEYCHGEKPHLVLYNDLYGAILDSDFKSTSSPLFYHTERIPNNPMQKQFIYDFFKQRFNFTVTESNLDAIARIFCKVNRQRAYHVYTPGECTRGKAFYRLFRQREDGSSQAIVPSEQLSDDIKFSFETRWYFHWLKNIETGEITTYLDDSNTRLPYELIEQVENEEDYEIRGPLVIYEMKYHDDETGYDYYRFKVGGAGANRISYWSNALPEEIDVDENYPDVKMYIEYKYPSLTSKVKIDEDHDYSTLSYFRNTQRFWPFAIRLNVTDILSNVKPMKKSDRGQIKCRIGFFYPDSGKFSRPSEWFKISLHHHNSPLTATFLR